MNIVDLSLELIKELFTYVAPAAFLWLLVSKAANAIIRAATGRSNGGL